VIWFAVIICAVLTTNLLNSRTGRAIRALRRGHVAAEAFGVETARAKLLVFIYAAVLAGLSGWLYAHFQRAVNPTPFGLNASIEYLFIAVVGGAGYVWGAVLGAGIVVVLKEFLQSSLPVVFHGSAQLETVIFGILLVALLQIAPGGMWPRLAALFPFTPKLRQPEVTAALPAAHRPQEDNQQPLLQQPLLNVVKVRKQFGGIVAVNDVSFDVRTGEIVALIGPNGAGKSTTFNLITGVLPASAGNVSVLGKDTSNAPPQDIVKLGVARTFQHVKLVPDMSVLENVAIGAHLRGHAGALASMLRLDRSDEAKLLSEAARQIERVGLRDQMHQLAGSLSLGQQRIVEIARALCVNPLLLLLDEPAAGLRHMEKQKLSALLRQLRSEGMSVLLVEHDMGFVMDIADRIVVLEFGTKIAEGAPGVIRSHPDVIKAYLGGAA
jgi:branched-chain amino acid transport system permease protein